MASRILQIGNKMANYDLNTDEELISLLRDGDERVIDYLMEKYKDLVRKKASNMFILGADKDDLIQEGMIRLFRSIRDYDPGRDASFFTFADLCISRQIYKAIEAGNCKKNAPLNSYVSLNVSSNQNDKEESSAENEKIMEMIFSLSDKSPEELVIDKENTQILEEKINNALSEFERQVLSLHMTGMGYLEIARVLGKEGKSTDNALNRIKTKVKKIINS